MPDADVDTNVDTDGEPQEDDLRGGDLRGADLRRRDLSGRDLSGATLSGARMRRCSLRGADLSGAKLDGADLVDADLREADLRGAALGGALLEGARLQGADLSDAHLARLSLRGVDLRRATLAGADLEEAHLIDGELAGADLSGANLTRANLSFADLRGAVLGGATLDGADLSGAHLERADLRQASVKGARMAWIQGLDAEARRELLERGARIPVSWLAQRWASLNAVARRRAAALYLGSILVLAGLSLATAHWAGGRLGRAHLYAINAPAAGVLFEVDCGGKGDRPFKGKAGHIGGQRHSGTTEGIQRIKLAPARVYGTERRGAEFRYAFHVSPGWYELQLHFVELEHHRKGSRTFDIRVEDEVVAQDFDILAEAYPQAVLVRRWGVWVDDGELNLHFLRKHVRALAKVNFIRVRRIDTPANWRRQPGDP
jgi:uncharacterized protein YjbI with pentapeptide repeats